MAYNTTRKDSKLDMQEYLADEDRNNNVSKLIGPSGVRALPLAAGINEGGHYFRYFSFSWWCYRRYSKPKKGLS
jgi:hypothetical protein